ncbi:MAG TPA: hypothetical protein VFE65_06580 [Pseudonocardia sp.]|jgi:hypothetical protein|nr:hypothetical protein [Pseudonocardia sp.]
MRDDQWGGQDAPADRWGRCPIRGRAVTIAQKVLLDASDDAGLTASRIIDDLIFAGIIPDELDKYRGGGGGVGPLARV